MSHGKYFYHNHWCQIDDHNLSYYHPEMQILVFGLIQPWLKPTF
jgi:hypothetical protein